MKVDRFPGATYTDARLDGQVAVLFPNPIPMGNFVKPPFIQLRDRQIMLPGQLKVGDVVDLPMFLRVPRDGPFKIAAKSHNGAGNLEWTVEKGWQVVNPVSYGNNPVIYQGQGLKQATPADGSQGFRYITLQNQDVITGDATVNDQTAWARACGVHDLDEWTQLGDITVGQSPIDGCVAECQGKRYLLEPGNVTFIRFDSDGENCVVSIVKPEGSVIKWFTRTELIHDFFPPERTVTPTNLPIYVPTAVMPKITIHDYTPTLQKDHPWYVSMLIGDTSVIVTIDAAGNLKVTAGNSAGADATGKIRHIEVK